MRGASGHGNEAGPTPTLRNLPRHSCGVAIPACQSRHSLLLEGAPHRWASDYRVKVLGVKLRWHRSPHRLGRTMHKSRQGCEQRGGRATAFLGPTGMGGDLTP